MTLTDCVKLLEEHINALQDYGVVISLQNQGEPRYNAKCWLAALKKADSPEPKTCRWVAQVDMPDGCYISSCGHTYTAHGELSLIYCPYCSDRIVVTYA